MLKVRQLSPPASSSRSSILAQPKAPASIAEAKSA